MLKVRLSTSPHIRHPAVLERDFLSSNDLMYGFAPVGLLSLIAVVREELGFAPELFDLNRRIADGTAPLGPEFYDHIADALCAGTPDVVGLMTECDSYHHVLQICERIKARGVKHVVLGGPHASAVAAETMHSCAAVDSIVVGEGERAFAALLRAYAADDALPVAGVVRRGLDGNLVDGGPAFLVEDLDALPIPAYDLYTPDEGEEIFLEVGRGCPFKCTFCSTAPFWRRRHRVKSPERILAEMQLVAELYGPRRVHFTHDLFTTDRKWVRALCSTLIAHGSTTPWTCSARTDLIDDELLSTMAAAGCSAIYFGIESGSKRVLDAVDKDVSIDRSLWALERCRAHGITPNAGFILGFPQDAEDSARDTFDAFVRAIELGCRPTHIFGFCPFVASSMFEGLGRLRHTGHFIDLPLGRETDVLNRAYVAANPTLFASFFRAESSGLWKLGPGCMEGIDEFSPLVEAATLPALALARRRGGMLEVYRAWIAWVGSHNEARDADPGRRWYGSPAQFCRFLTEALAAAGAPEADVAAVLEVGFQLCADRTILVPAPTSMASHRSIPERIALRDRSLNVRVRRCHVARTLAVNHDVAAALAWRAGEPKPQLQRTTMHLAWRISPSGDIALLVVDEPIYALLNDLEAGPMSAAQLVALWSRDPPRAARAHLDGVTACLDKAAEAGLVELA